MDVSGTLRTPTGSCKVVGSIIYLKKTHTHTHNQKMDERYEKGRVPAESAFEWGSEFCVTPLPGNSFQSSSLGESYLTYCTPVI